MSRPDPLERYLNSWSEYYNEKVKPHDSKIDAWDVTIIKGVHRMSLKKDRYVSFSAVHNYVIINCGFINEVDLAHRIVNLMQLAILDCKLFLNIGMEMKS